MRAGQHPGPLMAIGGGEDKTGKMEVLREFVGLCGGPEDARIVVMSVASTVPEDQDETYREAFGRLGVRDLRVLETNSRADADRPRSVAALAGATGVFFTGGDQKRILHYLKRTKLDDELHRLNRQGTVIAGTSAGASMISETMLDEGDSGECPRKAVVSLAEGMGFIHGLIIDQHFSQRGRMGRLLAAVAEKPELLGIGIGEDTAMIVEGSGFRVVGRGVVMAVDGRDLSVNDVEKRRKNEPLTLSSCRLHTVGIGHRFCLESRSVVPEEAASLAG